MKTNFLEKIDKVRESGQPEHLQIKAIEIIVRRYPHHETIAAVQLASGEEVTGERNTESHE